MFSSLRNRFGIPGVISVIALVFAVVGGAYAANNFGGQGKSKATASAKAKKGPRGPKGPQGAAGPMGTQGPIGPAGPNGADGKAGADGAAGKDGQGVTSVAFGVGQELAQCPAGQGGSKFITVSGTTYACSGKIGEDGEKGEEGEQGEKGEDGETGFTETLPPEKTLRGSWSVGPASAAAAEDPFLLSLSFGIPLAVSPDRTGYKDEAGSGSLFCEGTAEAPTAPPGVLCVYAQKNLNWKIPIAGFIAGMRVLAANNLSPDAKSGAVLKAEAEAAGAVEAYGTWAVTAAAG